MLKDNYLKKEAIVFSRQLFYCDPSEETINAYINAHATLYFLIPKNTSEINTVKIIIEKGLDATGIEYWLRGSGSRHILTCKLLLVSYLAECSKDSSIGFRAESVGAFRSLASIVRVILKTPFVIVRGWIHKVAHDLV